MHYARGLELAGQADYEAALREFNDAYTVSPHFAVLYNIGQAEVALGRPREAIADLSKYLRDGQEQVPPARRLEVQAQIALLESLFADLTITTDRPGALIAVDGREVGRTPLYQSLRLPAGTHRVTATPEGVRAAAPAAAAAGDLVAINRTVTLAPGERQVLNIELPAPPPVAVKAAEPEPPPQPPAPPAPGARAPSEPTTAPLPSLARDQHTDATDTGRGRAMSIVGYSAVAAGAALGGVALGVYLHNRDRYQDWRNNDAALRRDPGAIDFYMRQVANNQLADSLGKTNHVIEALTIGGGLILAGGVTLLVLDWVHRGEIEETPAGRAGAGISVGWGGQGPSSGNVSWSTSW